MDGEQIRFLEKKVELYLLDNEIEVSVDEKNEIIETLIKGSYDRAERGGIIAIRGFVYQYLVMVYYMLCIVSKKIDWDYVVFELGDDIALIKENRICFCQVKTKEENGGFINFYISKDLVKRSKKLDSWIDKLFLNSKKIKSKMDSVNISYEDGIEVSFKLIINTLDNSESELAPYCLTTKKNDKSMLLKTKLEEVKVKDGQAYKLVDELENTVDWYIDRFDIEPLGIYDQLMMKCKYLVGEIVGDGSDDTVLKKIVEELISSIIFNTHNDNLEDESDKKKFIVKMDNYIGFIKEREQYVANQMHFKRQQKILSKMFDNAFEHLQKNYKEKYSPLLSDQLINSMQWLRESLMEKLDEDSFVYERFINRIYGLENTKTVLFDNQNEIEFYELTNSLDNIIMYMVFYKYRNFNFNQKSKLVFKKGIYSNKEFNLTTYDVRNRRTMIEAVSALRGNIVKCETFNSLTGEIICFILNYKDEPIEEYLDFGFESKITKKNDEFKVISKPNNLKICDTKKLNGFFEALQLNIENNNIKEGCDFSEEVFWQKYLDINMKE